MKKILLILIISIVIFSCTSLQIKEDKINNTKDISHNSNNPYEENLLSLTVRTSKTKPIFLLYISTGYINNWIFLQSVEIYDSHDETKIINFNLDEVESHIDESKYGAFVYEYSTVKLSAKELEQLYKILKYSKKINIIYNGANFHEEKTLGKSTKESVLKTIEYYYETIAKKPLSYNL